MDRVQGLQQPCCPFCANERGNPGGVEVLDRAPPVETEEDEYADVKEVQQMYNRCADPLTVVRERRERVAQDILRECLAPEAAEQMVALADGTQWEADGGVWLKRVADQAGIRATSTLTTGALLMGASRRGAALPRDQAHNRWHANTVVFSTWCRNASAKRLGSLKTRRKMTLSNLWTKSGGKDTRWRSGRARRAGVQTGG